MFLRWVSSVSVSFEESYFLKIRITGTDYFDIPFYFFVFYISVNPCLLCVRS